MIKFTTRMNTLEAGDYLSAARDVGGNCSIGPCDENDICSVTCIIPRNRIEDFTLIVEERAAL